MATHELKTWPVPFQAVLDRRKTHEIRAADRPFAVGDVLRLREWNPMPNRDAEARSDYERTWGIPTGYSGRAIDVEVTYLTPGGEWSLPPDLCVMSIRRLDEP